MYNWSTDVSRLKLNPKAYEKWKLEQMINFGLGNEKINKKQLKKHFSSLNIDPKKKEFIRLLLWPNRTWTKTNPDS